MHAVENMSVDQLMTGFQVVRDLVACRLRLAEARRR